LPSFKRLVRGFRAIFGIARPDDAWARARLRPSEFALYRRLDPRDREHAVLVAKELVRRYPDAPPEAVRAALLHDVGKAVRPYRAVERILTALLEPWAPEVPARPLDPGWRGAWQVRRHHPEYAAELIEDPRVAGIVRDHHRGVGVWARRLREIDEGF